jgi:hypothetical protein
MEGKMRFALWTVVPLAIFLSILPAKADVKLRLLYADDMSMNTTQFPANGEIDFVIKKNDIEVYGNVNGDIHLVGSKSRPYGDLFGPFKFSVHASAHSLQFIGVYRSHIERAVVTTDGVSSCSATISLALKRGFSEYEYQIGGFPIRISDQRIHNVRCELTTV